MGHLVDLGRRVVIDQDEFTIRIFPNRHYGEFHSNLSDEDGPLIGYLWFSFDDFQLEEFSGRHNVPEELLDILVEYNYCTPEKRDELAYHVRSMRF